MRRAWSALLLAFVLVAGCSDGPTKGVAPADEDKDGLSDAEERDLGTDPGTADSDGDGVADGIEAAEGEDPTNIATFLLSDTGRDDAGEPSVGITSSGCIFFVAFSTVVRSCDHGKTWAPSTGPLQSPTSSDPYLWVDPVTDRVFDIQMVSTQCTWISWSDDDGATWDANPYDCGTYPGNDHIKLATGPWTDQGYGPLGKMLDQYPQAVYFCHNVPGVYCYTSFDGGRTFPVGAQYTGDTGSAGGLHGAIATAPDGTVYVEPRLATPTVAYSKDNGQTWTLAEMGKDVGTPNPRKNSEVAVDTASNAYHVWIGNSSRVYLSRSTDSGVTWEQASIPVSPLRIVSSTFPHIAAGDPGRIAVAYLGSEDAALLNTSDIDDEPWTGNPHYAPPGVTYRMYVTFSLNALDPVPTWHTVKLTSDPVQAGSICISSGDCRDFGGSNRNLLDFNDLSIDRDGRLYLGYADGCTGDCAKKDDPQPEDSRSQRGIVAILQTGPSLYADKGTLTAP